MSAPNYPLRLDSLRRAGWKRAAALEGRTLAGWIKITCDKACQLKEIQVINPNDLETIHQCDLLEYNSLYLELLFPDDPQYRRWALCVAEKGEVADSDSALVDAVAFCPGCGMDCRKELDWRVPGRPAFNEILESLQKEAQ